MNGASMWGRPIKVGRPTQAQPYIKTIESTINDSRRTTCLYVSNIHPVRDWACCCFLEHYKITFDLAKKINQVKKHTQQKYTGR